MGTKTELFISKNCMYYLTSCSLDTYTSSGPVHSEQTAVYENYLQFFLIQSNKIGSGIFAFILFRLLFYSDKIKMKTNLQHEHKFKLLFCFHFVKNYIQFSQIAFCWSGLDLVMQMWPQSEQIRQQMQFLEIKRSFRVLIPLVHSILNQYDVVHYFFYKTKFTTLLTTLWSSLILSRALRIMRSH